MINDLTVFIIIAVLFVLMLWFKEWRKIKLCALCAAVSLTWLGVLWLYWFGYYQNTVLLALLLGQTVVGLYYLLEKKVKESLRVFRLPFFLSLTLVAYSLLSSTKNTLAIWLFLGILWCVALFVYLKQSSPRLQALAKKLIDCCKNW